MAPWAHKCMEDGAGQALERGAFHGVIVLSAGLFTSMDSTSFVGRIVSPQKEMFMYES